MASLQFDAIRTLAYTGISSSYASVGAVLAHNWRMFKITNNTDGDMLFSVNASTNQMFCPANSFTLYDVATNAQPVGVSDNLMLAIGTQFSVKQSTAPSKGAVWIEGLYAIGE